MPNKSEIERIAEGLTEAQRKAIRKFQPGIWYGVAQPSRSAAFCKGRLVEMGLVEHDGGAPASSYRLTPFGTQVRASLQDQS